MEFLRFGSSIPGDYWGCCACCIIQNFKFEPSAKASINLVHGDNGVNLGKFAGPTYEDIFRARIRIGTFSTRDMPNHAFFAILTETQVSGGVGKKWLKILKEEGFEFIRTVDNSVYSGKTLIEKPGDGNSAHKNYIFGLFRNIGSGAVPDPYKPPKEWTDLPAVVPEANISEGVELNKAHQEYQLKRWKANSPTELLTEAEVIAAGAPVTMAGQRLPGAAPESKEARLARTKTVSNPFGTDSPKAAA